jgi:hypothetical protein
MSRLLMFLSFAPATYQLMRLNSDDALMYFLGAFVLGYVGGKLGDGIGRRADRDS